ncbi:hypothetical protein [Luteimonas sp. SDU82]|uniref:hypothetical protein n=1 Tax=Luteimonas sp. SDU82 TaxID=3422592 RepID=UPI003EBD5FE0
MNKKIAEAIRILEGLPSLGDVDQRENFKQGADDLAKLAAELDTRGTGELRAFQTADSPYWHGDDGGSDVVLVPTVEGVPRSLSNCVDRAWRLIGGCKSPSLAFSIIAAARCEFTRSYFNTVTAWLSFVSDPQFRPRGDAERVSAILRETAWEDADSVARAPVPLWGDDCSARDFNEWLWNVNPEDHERPAYLTRAPSCEVGNDVQGHEMLYAMALTWMDAAALGPENLLTLMAEAADAMDHAGCRMGWDMHGKYGQEEVAEGAGRRTVEDLARHAANVRHAPNRARAERLRAAYLSGDFKSKDAAAEKLAPLFGMTFRTAREHLKGC